MQQILQTHLQHKVYNADEAQRMSKLIAEEVKAKLIGMLQGETAAATYHTNARGIKTKGPYIIRHASRKESQFCKGRMPETCILKHKKVSASQHSSQDNDIYKDPNNQNYASARQQEDLTKAIIHRELTTTVERELDIGHKEPNIRNRGNPSIKSHATLRQGSGNSNCILRYDKETGISISLKEII